MTTRMSFLLLMIGCTSYQASPAAPYELLPPSDKFASSALAFSVDAQSNGLKTEIRVIVNASGRKVQLVGSDALFASAADTSRVPLNGFPSFVIPRPTEVVSEQYVGLLATQTTRVTLVFTRAGLADETASIDLPPPFTLRTPVSAPRSSPITIGWESSPSDAATLLFKGCGPSFMRPLGTDTGSFTLQPADLMTQGKCTLVVTMTRTRVLANTGPGFPRAESLVTQTRTVTLETTP